MSSADPSPSGPTPHKRRPRYPGKNPRRFDQKYKERDPLKYADTVARVLESGKTPAGTHRSIMVEEILQALAPQPGELAVDCTLGYGGHSAAILPHLLPGGRLIGIDADPIEIARTEARLRALGFGPECFQPVRSNFAGLPKILAQEGRPADLLLADLGISSMQIDDPSRGFSIKEDGPLDMRMNPRKGLPAGAYLARIAPGELAQILEKNADEPHAVMLSEALAGRLFETTHALARAVRQLLPRAREEDAEDSVRRVFQALRIAVNDEFAALDTLLRHLPECLSKGGRVAILSFHSGEDRRVKKAFEAGLAAGHYARVSPEVQRPSAEERRANTRSAPAKLRWAVRA